jgi:hypothetical protein
MILLIADYWFIHFKIVVVDVGVDVDVTIITVQVIDAGVNKFDFLTHGLYLYSIQFWNSDRVD